MHRVSWHACVGVCVHVHTRVSHAVYAHLCVCGCTCVSCDVCLCVYSLPPLSRPRPEFSCERTSVSPGVPAPRTRTDHHVYLLRVFALTPPGALAWLPAQLLGKRAPAQPLTFSPKSQHKHGATSRSHSGPGAALPAPATASRHAPENSARSSARRPCDKGGEAQIINWRSEGRCSGRFWVWGAGPFISQPRAELSGPAGPGSPSLAEPKPGSDEHSEAGPGRAAARRRPHPHPSLPAPAFSGDPPLSVPRRKSLSVSEREAGFPKGHFLNQKKK